MSIVASAGRRLLPLRDVMSTMDYLRVKRMQRFRKGATNIDGVLTRFSDSLGLLHSAKEIYVDEVYRFRAEGCSPRIIDVGANIGLSVRYFKRLYPDSHIVAYEPDPQIFALLQSNVKGLPNVDLRNAAAWVNNTSLTFYSEGSLAGSSEIDFKGSGHSFAVRAERLKDELRVAYVDFLKVDIEGAENSLLFDIEDELEGVGLLFFEYHSLPGSPQKLGELLNLVQRKGFRYQINGVHGPRLPFVERVNTGFDLQLNVSCFR